MKIRELETAFRKGIRAYPGQPALALVTDNGALSASLYVVKTSGTKGEPLKRATWTLTGSGSSQICQPPFG